MRQAGNADNARGRPPGNHGFTWLELFVLIAGAIILWLLFLPHLQPTMSRKRVPCLSNQNNLWKAASSWGLDPVQTWRPCFPETNLAYSLAVDNAGVSPEIFICPYAAKKKIMSGISIAGETLTHDIYGAGKNKSWGISAATNLASIRATNSNYAYFGGRILKDGTLVLIADKNGSTNLPSATSWGGNHDGAGGNVVKVGGQGYWVATTAGSKDAQYCITNADIVAAFSNTGPVFAY